jgi:hypothetical protein
MLSGWRQEFDEKEVVEVPEGEAMVNIFSGKHFRFGRQMNRTRRLKHQKETKEKYPVGSHVKVKGRAGVVVGYRQMLALVPYLRIQVRFARGVENVAPKNLRLASSKSRRPQSRTS